LAHELKSVHLGHELIHQREVGGDVVVGCKAGCAVDREYNLVAGL
jgi:hypothetical protein